MTDFTISDDVRLARPRRVVVAALSFVATALPCLLAFGWMLTFGTFRFVADDSFGSFYDHQAAAWLNGRWDVPEPALSGEAFVVEGKIYGYFGPTPALLRLPLVALGVGFGQVTRILMLLDYAACLLGAYAMLWLATRWPEPFTPSGVKGSPSRADSVGASRDEVALPGLPRPVGAGQTDILQKTSAVTVKYPGWHRAAAVPSPGSTVLFVSTVGLGSTLFFLGSRAYVYHEAILCGAAFAIWAVYCALRHLQSPARRWWISSLVCGVLAVHARPPIGLFALTVLGCVALFLCLAGSRTGSSGPRREHLARRFHRCEISGLAVAALSALGILSYNLVSYLKFGTWEGCPLRYNVQYTPHQLAVLGHRNFHASNLRFNTDAYLLRPSFSLSREFPYVYREYLDRRQYPESRMAYRDQTLAMPWSMPGLFLLAAAGSGIAFASTAAFRRPLALLWLAAIPAAGAMLTAVAVTQRYTADFVPFLVGSAAFGTVALASVSGVAGRLARAATLACALLGLGVTFALTLHHQRDIVWGVPEEVRSNYQRMRRSVDAFFGGSQAD